MDGAAGQEAVDVHIDRLRKQLADSGLTIVTLRGLGYLLEAA